MYNKFPQIKHRLAKEIQVCESFNLPYTDYKMPLGSAIDYLFSGEFKQKTIAQRSKIVASIYPAIFKKYPIVKVHYPEHLFESQLIIETKENFLKKLKIK